MERGGSDLVTTPPHDITGKGIGHYLPQGPGSEKIKSSYAPFLGTPCRPSGQQRKSCQRIEAGDLHLALGAGKGAANAKDHGTVSDPRRSDLGG